MKQVPAVGDSFADTSAFTLFPAPAATVDHSRVLIASLRVPFDFGVVYVTMHSSPVPHRSEKIENVFKQIGVSVADTYLTTLQVLIEHAAVSAYPHLCVNIAVIDTVTGVRHPLIKISTKGGMYVR